MLCFLTIILIITRCHYNRLLFYDINISCNKVSSTRIWWHLFEYFNVEIKMSLSPFIVNTQRKMSRYCTKKANEYKFYGYSLLYYFVAIQTTSIGFSKQQKRIAKMKKQMFGKCFVYWHSAQYKRKTVRKTI